MKIYDCIIVGGGPAGLSAAIYMARFNRSVLVIDAGGGRASGKQKNENYLGFPKGIRASELLELGKKQAKHFGVKFLRASVNAAERAPARSAKAARTSHADHASQAGQHFKIETTEGKQRSKTLIIATGVKDHYPAFPGLMEYIGSSVFWCIICDGYKVRNKKLVVVGHDDKATVTAAEFLLYTKDIIFLTNCDKGSDEISDEGFKRLKKAGISVEYGSIKKVQEKKGKKGMMKYVELDTGKKVRADFMFNKQGYTPNSDIASCLNAILEGEGFVKTDNEQKTNIDGLYAAGDVTSEAAHQIATAVHQGSVAATSANEYLLKDFQK